MLSLFVKRLRQVFNRPLPPQRVLRLAGRALDGPHLLGVVGLTLNFVLALLGPVHLLLPETAKMLLGLPLVHLRLDHRLLVRLHVLH